MIIRDQERSEDGLGSEEGRDLSSKSGDLRWLYVLVYSLEGCIESD